MPETLKHPKKPRRNKMAQPPSKKLIRITDRTSDVQQILYQQNKQRLMQMLNKDLDAHYAANSEPSDYVMLDVEIGHDMFVATGLLFGILKAKKR